MSLITLLREKDVYLKFKETFPKPKFSEKRELLAPPLTENYVFVGHAFDYLLRFHLEQKYPKLTDNGGIWIADLGLDFIKTMKRSPRLHKAAASIVKNAEKQYNQFLKTGILEDNLISSCILLSKIDVIYRTGGNYFPDTLDEFLDIDEKDIQDLKNLISIVPFDDFKPEVGILLNPTFGLGSIIVGGSDGDVILDDTIIEI